MIQKRKLTCCICFQKLYHDNSLHSLFSFSSILCEKCLKQFKIIHKYENILGIETLFLYEYNAFLKKLIYQYKGCYDLELKDVFFFQFKKEIQKKYKGYIIVYPPSNESEDKQRGFRHIEQMVSCLHLPSIHLFFKKEAFKQSSQSFSKRKEIQNILQMNTKNLLLNQKYLIVDDIYTSGFTLKTLIQLLVQHRIPKENIKALILSKTAEFVEL